MNPDVLELNLQGGVRIAVPRDYGTISTYVALEQEDWFEEEIRFVRAWLRPGMRAVDIGANFGAYSLAMARSVGAAGRVLAFEPAPSTARYLGHSLALNGFGHATLERVAVSSSEGSIAFELGSNPELAFVDPAGIGSLRVPAAPLDALLARHGMDDADFVKIDVEGHELQVVEGGERFFASGSPLVMLEVRVERALDLRALRRLESLGYRAYRLVPGLLMLEPWSSERPSDPYLLNLFACKPERAAQLAEAGRLHSQERPSKLDALRAENASTLEALNRRPGVARLMAYARTAWELGERAQAVLALEQALQAWRARPGLEADEPCRAPLPAFDGTPPTRRDAEWLACAIIESYDRLRYFSSLYASVPLPELERIRGSDHATPQLERRLQLLAILQGAQQGPRAAPKLRKSSEQNLNPGFWCGEDGTTGSARALHDSLRGIAGETARYFGASAAAFAADFAIYVALIRLAGWHYLLAAPAGFGAGLLVAYVLSIRWVFATRRVKDARLEFFLFAAIGLLGMAANEAVLYGAVAYAGTSPEVAKLVSAAVVFTMNFALRKLLLFTHFRATS